MTVDLQPEQSAARAGYLSLRSARIYYRQLGQGPPLFILHGGPDFSHDYLLPEMDRLSADFRLVYYDQRGRGRSARGVRPEEVSLASEVADLDGLREHLALDRVALLGHSWGALLALEYATRYARRVSSLALLNIAPVSRADYHLLRQERRKNAPDDIERLKALAATPRYQQGDLVADDEYYRIHFRAAFRHAELLDRLVGRLRVSFTPEGVLQAREIEDRLYKETWGSSEYDLLPRLAGLDMPALLIHGEADFVPVECAVHVARAIPGARLVVLKDCGHFSYLECPDEVFKEVSDFLRE
jgi:proline iminopeptidase